MVAALLSTTPRLVLKSSTGGSGANEPCFPRVHSQNSDQSSSLTLAVCPGVRLAGAVAATPLAKRLGPTALG